MDRYRAHRERLETAVLASAGHTDPALRRAVAAGADPASAELAPYLAKVREAASTITDAEVAALQAAGWSDDELFELTLAAALGAAGRKLEAALDALAEEDAGETAEAS